MANSRSRSRSPRASRDERPRHRSRSPRRDDRDRRERSDRDRRDRDDRDRRPRARNDRGFRWKEKKSTADEPDNRRLERGYNRDRDSDRRRDNTKKDSSNGGVDVADKFGAADKFGTGKTEKSSTSTSASKDTSKAPERAPPAPAQGEEMIIVHVNDRLGTKAAIPCLASDPIKMFKAMVAAKIGREPHEILLKRQGERPFKDQLTLEDYGVSNGVQLDLEVDTGD